jgi:HEPN domain
LPAPSPEQRDYARLLLDRARSDLGAFKVLMADSDMLDDVVGFHAQQAVEKALKVSLVLADIDFATTIHALEHRPASPATTIGTKHRTRRVSHGTQHKRVTRRAVTQDRPEDHKPVPTDISTRSYRCAHRSSLPSARSAICILATIREPSHDRALTRVHPGRGRS